MKTGNRKSACLVISTNKCRCFRQANIKYCLYTETFKTTPPTTKKPNPNKNQLCLNSESADANFYHCF